jgi:hypothetical protein
MIKVDWFKLNLILLPIITYVFTCDVLSDLETGVTWITLLKGLLIVLNIFELNTMFKKIQK